MVQHCVATIGKIYTGSSIALQLAQWDIEAVDVEAYEISAKARFVNTFYNLG